MSTLAVVVFSGGLDSTTALAEAVQEHGKTNVHAVSFNYGQRHSIELECAKHIAREIYNVNHAIYNLPAKMFVGGVLTTDEDVPDMRYDDLASGVMSPTYVPFRNGNLLAQSAAYADSVLRETEKFMDGEHEREVPANPWDSALIYAGMHSEDAAGFAYADCTPEFLGAVAASIYIGTYGRVRLNALYQHATKVQIIGRGHALGVPYGWTHSCYRGKRPACGTCSTCQARLEAFAAAGYADPLPYEQVGQ